MKKWAVYFKTESSDEYHRFFESQKKPTTNQLIDYFCQNIDPDCKGVFNKNFHPIHEITEIKYTKL